MPTLKELLEKGESFKYGIDYRKVEADKDTLVEFETQGIRPKFTIRQPLLYGTQTLRITRRSTNILDDMKESRNNEGGSLGLLGGVIGKAKETLGDLASKIGIPEAQIPTRVSTDSDFKKTDTSKIPETLAKIRKDAAGSLVGKFLKQNAQGTPKQIGRQAIGGGIALAKSKLRDAVFGTTGDPNLSPSAEETINTKSVSDAVYNHNLNPYYKSVRTPGFPDSGLRLTWDSIQTKQSWTKGFIDNKSQEDGKYFGSPQINNFPQFSVESLTQNIPGRRSEKNRYLADNETTKAGEFRVDLNKYGKFRTTRDTINSSTVWEGSNSEGQSPGENPPIDKESGKTLDDMDFIPLRFYSVAKNQGVSFRATLNGINETFSPSWESSNFIGNPFSFYTYQNINRKFDFSFTVYSLNALEHRKSWERIDFLSSLVYPQNKNSNDVYVTPPLLKVTMGNMYKNKLGFIESLSYTVDDNYPWEIGLDVSRDGNVITNMTDNGYMKNYKLPKMINVTISYQVIESNFDAINTRLYSYGDFPSKQAQLETEQRGIASVGNTTINPGSTGPSRQLQNQVSTQNPGIAGITPIADQFRPEPIPKPRPQSAQVTAQSAGIAPIGNTNIGVGSLGPSRAIQNRISLPSQGVSLSPAPQVIPGKTIDAELSNQWDDYSIFSNADSITQKIRRSDGLYGLKPE